jgi:alpha-mannosidase
VEVFAGQAARPVVIADPSDTWGHNVYSFDQEIGAFTPTSVRLVEQGPVKAALRVRSSYGASFLTQDFILYKGARQVEVQVTIDWREQHKLLKLRFPLNLTMMRATYEIPYGHIERFANGQEEPGQTWVDVSGISRENGERYGLSLLNDGKYSFDVRIRDIGMTVLRSPIYVHHMPVEPDPEQTYTYMDQGVQRFTYVLLPHPGSWEQAGTVQRAAELNQRPVVLAGTVHPEGKLPPRLRSCASSRRISSSVP